MEGTAAARVGLRFQQRTDSTGGAPASIAGAADGRTISAAGGTIAAGEGEKRPSGSASLEKEAQEDEAAAARVEAAAAAAG